MIYFIRRPSDGLIKVGRTLYFVGRLRSLASQYGPGLRLLGVVSEDRHRENTLHRRFSHLWVEGEWYSPGPDLLDFIEAHAYEWSPTDDGLPVRLPAPLVEQARAVAEMEGATLADVVAGILGPALAVREREAQERRAAAVGLD